MTLPPAPKATPPTQAGLITLVEPSSRHADRYLADVSHPTCRDDPDCRVDPRRLLASLRQHPGGRERCDERAGCLLAYRFWIHLDAPGHVGFSGRISFRIPAANRPGRRLTRYVGHIGYVVFPQARGRRIAARATRMLLPLADAHGLADSRSPATRTISPADAPSSTRRRARWRRDRRAAETPAPWTSASVRSTATRPPLTGRRYRVGMPFDTDR